MSIKLRNEKAVVVFSGGQDSTTCLLWALHSFKEVEAITFNYNQRHSLEIEQAKKICEDLNVKQHILDMSLLNQLAPCSLTRSDIEVDKYKDTKDKDGVPNSFVPGRNIAFLTFGAILAEQIGAKHLVTGVCETDFSGYPDCRNTFIQSLNTTLNLGLNSNITIHTPLMWLNKAETWELADIMDSLDYIRENTLTCYNGIVGDGCGECPSCALRRQGLEEYLNLRG